jgi:pyrroloquinoline-quinone synthase
VLREAPTPERQKGVIDMLYFKTDVLWAKLDAPYHDYVDSGQMLPGASSPTPGYGAKP